MGRDISRVDDLKYHVEREISYRMGIPVDPQFFAETTVRICGDLDIERSLARTFGYVRDRIPAHTLGLGFFDTRTMHIRVVALATADDAVPLWTDTAREIQITEVLARTMRTADSSDPWVLVINRPFDLPDGEWLSVFNGLRTNSAMFMELGLRGEDVGVLLVGASGLGRYTSEHARLLESVREPFAIAMSNARRYGELARLRDILADDHRALKTDVKRSLGSEVVGADFGLRDVMEQVRQVAASPSPALLLGETGTGKEVIANAIHMASPRRSGPMISMQCGAIPDTLLDSELFGHEKGAFTGAHERKRGRFERAHRGTLFLDEIGELRPEAQVKLLRVLQEHKLERVGGVETVEVDVRVIAATHRDLEQMVRDGRFREDLWYRLNVLPIRIPPLRLRREDISSLVHYFVDRKAKEMNLLQTPRVTSHDLARLEAYDWPGNVRELQNVVERALILSGGSRLEFSDLAPVVARRPNANTTRRSTTGLQSLDDAIASHIRAVLEYVDWRVAGPGGAAEVLRVNPSTLRSRMKKLGISIPSPGRSG